MPEITTFVCGVPECGNVLAIDEQNQEMCEQCRADFADTEHRFYLPVGTEIEARAVLVVGPVNDFSIPELTYSEVSENQENWGQVWMYGEIQEQAHEDCPRWRLPIDENGYWLDVLLDDVAVHENGTEKAINPNYGRFYVIDEMTY